MLWTTQNISILSLDMHVILQDSHLNKYLSVYSFIWGKYTYNVYERQSKYESWSLGLHELSNILWSFRRIPPASQTAVINYLTLSSLQICHFELTHAIEKINKYMKNKTTAKTKKEVVSLAFETS